MEERSRADVFPIFGDLFLVEDRWVSMCSNVDLCGGGVSPPLWPLWYGLRPLCRRRWLCIVFWFDFVMGKTIILDCTGFSLIFSVFVASCSFSWPFWLLYSVCFLPIYGF